MKPSGIIGGWILLLAAITCIGVTVRSLTACTPAQQAAIEQGASYAEGPLAGLCAFTEASAGGAFDIICPGAVSADQAIAALANANVQAREISRVTRTAGDGGAAVVAIRLSCTMRPRDGGGG